jgi:hypothetical protein
LSDQSYDARSPAIRGTAPRPIRDWHATEGIRMRRVCVLLLGMASPASRALPTEKAAKDRSECSVVAIDQSGFDPVTADEPPRTLASTHPRGGEVIGSGAVVKGAAGGAVAGVVGGAILGDAGKGARRRRRGRRAVRRVKRHRETRW